MFNRFKRCAVNGVFYVSVQRWLGCSQSAGHSIDKMYQRQLSMPRLWGRTMSNSESWGVNGHTLQCISIVTDNGGLTALAGVWLRTNVIYSN